MRTILRFLLTLPTYIATFCVMLYVACKILVFQNRLATNYELVSASQAFLQWVMSKDVIATAKQTGYVITEEIIGPNHTGERSGPCPACKSENGCEYSA